MPREGLTMSKRVDKPHPVSRMTLSSVRKPHYFHVYLWDSIWDLLRHVKLDDSTLAVTMFEPLRIGDDGQPLVPNKLGEIHYARDHWNVNIIAHETLHAVVHRMRLIWPPANLIMRDEYEDAEEEIAYEFGRWVEKTHSWLWKLDPPRDTPVDPSKRRHIPNVYWVSEARFPDIFQQIDEPNGATHDEYEGTCTGEQYEFDFDNHPQSQYLGAPNT
jgi:hypothetical protein